MTTSNDESRKPSWRSFALAAVVLALLFLWARSNPTPILQARVDNDLEENRVQRLEFVLSSSHAARVHWYDGQSRDIEVGDPQALAEHASAVAVPVFYTVRSMPETIVWIPTLVCLVTTLSFLFLWRGLYSAQNKASSLEQYSHVSLEELPAEASATESSADGYAGRVPPNFARVVLEKPNDQNERIEWSLFSAKTGRKVFRIHTPELAGAFVGLTTARVQNLFEQMQKLPKASVVVLGDVDAIGMKRAAPRPGLHEEQRMGLLTLVELLQKGIPSGLAFVMTTSRVEDLDEVLLASATIDAIVRI